MMNPTSFVCLRREIVTFCVLIVLLLSDVTFGQPKAQESLYSPEDPILQITAHEFNQMIFNRKKAFFAEFYSSWCGHCHHFAPVWRNFSYQIVNWRPVVELVAINCALEANTVLCRDAGIDMFPTMKYFKYNSQSLGDGKTVEQMLTHEPDKWKSSPDNLAHTLASILLVDWKSQVPVEWPRLTIADPNKPLAVKTGTEFIVAVFVADKDSDPSRIVGVQVLLNLTQSSNVQGVMVSTVHDLAKHFKQQDIQLPAIVILKKDATGETVLHAKGSVTKAQIAGLISEVVGSPSKTHKLKLPEQQVEAPLDTSVVDKTIQHQVHMTDLLSGLSYMLRQEIPLKKLVTDDQMLTLKSFMNLLRKYYPGTPPIRRLLHRLNDFLSSHSTIDGEVFAAAVENHNEELGRPLVKNITWVACKGSLEKYRGYPCSLWTIFHALTVGAYKTDGKDSSFSALDVLEAIHGYIKHFFGCTTCGENFERAAKKLPNEVQKREDAILWLWKSHNRANKFTEGDPLFPKTQFPPQNLCPRCHKGGTGDSTEWDEGEVLDFMIQYFSDVKTEQTGPNYKVVSFEKNGKRVSKERKLDINPKFGRLGQDVFQEENKLREIEAARKASGLLVAEKIGNEREKEGLYWTRLDKGICLTLWAISSLVCLGLFAYLKCRRNKNILGYGKYKV